MNDYSDPYEEEQTDEPALQAVARRLQVLAKAGKAPAVPGVLDPELGTYGLLNADNAPPNVLDPSESAPPFVQERKPVNQDAYVPWPLKAGNWLAETLDNLGHQAAQVEDSIPVVAGAKKTVIDTLEQLKQGGKQLYAGGLDATGQLPMNMAAGVTALGAKILDNIPDVSPLAAGGSFDAPVDLASTPAAQQGDNPLIDATNYLLNTGHYMHQGANYEAGVQEPQTAFEKTARVVGRSSMPGSLPMTATMVGGDLWNTFYPNAVPALANMFGVDSAKAMTPEEQQKAYTNALYMHGAIRGVTHTVDGQQVVLPGMTENGSPLTDDQARDYWTRGAQNIAVVWDRAKQALGRMYLQPDGSIGPDEVVHTLNGPYKVTRNDLTTMGWAGALTLGAGFVPAIARAIGTRYFPRVQPVPVEGPGIRAPEGLNSTATRMDHFRVSDDVYAPLIAEMERLHAPQAAIDQVRTTMRIQGGSAANLHIANAINNGEAEIGPNFRFQVQPQHALGEIRKSWDVPEYHDYLHLRDTMDELNLLANNNKKAAANVNIQVGQGMPLPGMPSVRGETIPSVLAKINAFEAAHPDARELAAAWRENLTETRKFMANGEFGRGGRWLVEQQRDRPNEVPWIGEPNSDPTIVVDRGNPFDAMQRYIQKNMFKRMHDEIKGQWTDLKSAYDTDNTIMKVPNDEAARAGYNTVYTFPRRGVKETWAVDPFYADIHNMDPYYLAGQADGALDAIRRGVQQTTTGRWAWQFAPVAGIRNVIITAMSPGEGMKNITPWGPIFAIPQQVTPILARSIGNTFEHLAGLTGSATLDAVSAKLADAYRNSFYAYLERGGMGYGNFMQSGESVNSSMKAWVAANVNPEAKAVANGIQELIGTLHNAGGYAAARRNRANFNSAGEAAWYARDVTGDPMITGAIYKSRNTPVRAPARSDRFSAFMATNWGKAIQLEKSATPWFNISLQGAKRVANAYWQNPVGFLGRMWLYTQLPAVMGYMWNQRAGTDPNGLKYTDYQMNMRHNYNTTMSQYWAVPGKPAAEGWEVPMRFHETAIAARWMEILLHHFFDTSLGQGLNTAMGNGLTSRPQFNIQDDADKALRAWLDVLAPPVVPPIVAAPMAALGVGVNGGPFGGMYTYDIKDNPFDADRQGWNRRYEMVARTFAPGMADWLASAAAAYSHTPTQDGHEKALQNFAEQAGRRIVEKTPILRDVTGIKPAASGSNDTTEMLFQKQKAIQHMLRFIRAEDEGHSGGWLNEKPVSESGGSYVDELMGKMPQAQPNFVQDKNGKLKDENAGYFPRAGLPIAEPTNPLYKMFTTLLQDKFSKDATEVNTATGKGSRSTKKNIEPTESIGYRTAWKDYGFFKEQVASMRNIDAGNVTTWRQRMEPDVRNYLVSNHVDTTNPRAVQNFFEMKRQQYARQILYSIRSVEREMTDKLADPTFRAMMAGQGVDLPSGPVTIEGLSPYLGKEAPDTWGLEDPM